MDKSSAEPARLAAYRTALGPIAESLDVVATRYGPAMTSFVDGAGGFAPSDVPDDWAFPLRALHDEIAYLGVWVAGVGTAFLDAGGDGDGDGVYEVADASSITSRIGSAVLAEQRELLAERLAALAEQARAGRLDMSVGELADVLAMARRLVDSSADPQGEAAVVISSMGPGDVMVALQMLGAGGFDLDDGATSNVAAVRDLGYVLSLGLDDHPRRARRWADEIVDAAIAGAAPWVAGELVEAVAVMGSGNAAGASAFTAAVFTQLATRAGPCPNGGVVDRLYGGTDPARPILVTAGSVGRDGRHPQAALANAVVRSVLDGGLMARVFGADGIAAVLAPEQRVYQVHLGEVLVASVDHALPPGDRSILARDLAGYYASARSVPFEVLEFSSPVTRGFAAATQPLLEGWRGHELRHLVLAPGTPQQLTITDDLLWDAVRLLADQPGGADGLHDALRGTTTVRLGTTLDPAEADAVAGDGLGPFRFLDLRSLGEVYRQVATEIGNARFRSVAGTAGGDTSVEDRTLAIVGGIVGEVPGGSTTMGIVDALASSESSREVTAGGNPLEGLAVQLTRDLVTFDLATVSELACDGRLLAVLERVARSEGALGLHTLLHSTDHPLAPAAGPGLRTLQDLVGRQEAEVALDLGGAVADTTTLAERDDRLSLVTPRREQ